MKHISVIAGIALAALALSGCKKETPAETATPAATPEAAPAATDPALAAAAAPADFDMRAFAGTFSGTLPCADCPGIDTRIVLAGDGSYTLEETQQGEAAAPVAGDGTWTAEDNGHRLRLDPNSKSEEDRVFEIVGKNEIRALGKDAAADDRPESSLKRVDAQ